MPSVRGMTFAGSVEYVRKSFGEEGLKKVLDSLPEEDKKIAGEKFHTMEWYSESIFANFLSSADKILGKGGHQICYQAGKMSAAEAFGGIYKLFLEFGGPNIFLKKAALAWRALNDTGYLEIEVSRENYVLGMIKEYENPHKCLCWHLVGYFEKVLELSGGKNVKAKETKCRCAGDDACQYETTWE